MSRVSNTQCSSPSILNAELESVRRKVSLQETKSWDIIEKGIVQLIQCCNNGGCDFTTDILAGIHSLSKPLNRAIVSERSSISGAAIELVTTLSQRLGPSFEPLLSLFIPTLLCLCARTNKVFTRRAKECVFAVIRNTQSPSILPYLAESTSHKSTSVRLVAAEGVLAYLNSFKAPAIKINTRLARLLEDVMKSTFRDVSADVRKAGAKIFETYKTLLPHCVESFIALLTPIARKHLAAQDMATSQPTSQLSRGHQTTGRTRPVVSLQTHKISGKYTEKPLNFKLRRENDAVCPVVRTTQHSQRERRTLMKPTDEKPRVAEMPRAIRKISSLSLKSSSEHHATRGTSSRIVQPGLHGPPSMGAQPQMPSWASRTKVVATRSSQQHIGQEKPVLGGQPMTKGSKFVVKAVSIPSKLGPGPSKAVASGQPLVQASNTPHVMHVFRDVSRSCIDENATASMCDVKTQDSHFDSPKAHRTPLSSIQGGSLCTPSHVLRDVSRPSRCLSKAPRRSRRDSIYMECLQSPQDRIDATHSSCDRPMRPLIAYIQRGLLLTPPSHDVRVPQDVNRPSIKVGPQEKSVHWTRGSKFPVFMDANPEDTDTTLVDRPSHMADGLQGDVTLSHSLAEAQLEAPHMLNTSRASNRRAGHRLVIARSPPSPRAAAIRRLGYRNRGLQRFDFALTLPLLPEVSLVSESFTPDCIPQILDILLGDGMF